MVKKQIAPVTAGSRYTVEIIGLGHSGEGVGRFQDFTIFVPQALPGEVVEVQVSEVKKNYAKAKLTGVKQASAERVEPLCSVYQNCGGCQLQHLSYAGQLNAKRQQVVDAVTRIGKLADVVVHPTMGAANPWYYRNKMQFPVGKAGGKVAVGCYSQGTHAIINTKNCCIQHAVNNTIADQVRRIVTEFNIPTYDERTGEGVIRHVMGRVGTATGEVMVALVTAVGKLPSQEKVIAALRQAIPGLASIVQNVNPKRGNIIMGETTRTIWGKDTITDKLGDLTFHISARSFFQVNTEQTVLLYGKAVEYAGLTGQETVIDAYCGTGTITLFLAGQAAKVYGIEIVKPAIADAWQNAQTNTIENVEFIAGDAVEVMPELYRNGIWPEVIVVDPPRAGCEPKVLETFVKMKPERIVYVSCNPASLARDLAILAEQGYQTVEIQPVDMFPHTHHVECVAKLMRKHIP
ncbi:23S rRNA (uracil(1939)-C(5))-methyltransferase RlmD [Anaerospora hongkongensis]|uniref:23S rRNA (uracil(1939)-C(5))-methyltransferase RlmD n=1 Tax=Anaerospora hongkongensis TaxID=244830 RepID=UPI0028A0E800|nr:23S rRNA (uracil(1939)-C(5))-methyltransferase RlmD [Anaerospora hongkongensis]